MTLDSPRVEASARPPLQLNKGHRMVQRPSELNAFEFVILAGLRAAQLARGCTPRVPRAEKVTVTAQMEVAEGEIERVLSPEDVGR